MHYTCSTALPRVHNLPPSLPCSLFLSKTIECEQRRKREEKKRFAGLNSQKHNIQAPEILFWVPESPNSGSLITQEVAQKFRAATEPRSGRPQARLRPLKGRHTSAWVSARVASRLRPMGRRHVATSHAVLLLRRVARCVASLGRHAPNGKPPHSCSLLPALPRRPHPPTTTHTHSLSLFLSLSLHLKPRKMHPRLRFLCRFTQKWSQLSPAFLQRADCDFAICKSPVPHTSNSLHPFLG